MISTTVVQMLVGATRAAFQLYTPGTCKWLSGEQCVCLKCVADALMEVTGQRDALMSASRPVAAPTEIPVAYYHCHRCKNTGPPERATAAGWVCSYCRYMHYNVNTRAVSSDGTSPVVVPPVQVGDKVKASNYAHPTEVEHQHTADWYNQRPFLIEWIERKVWRVESPT